MCLFEQLGQALKSMHLNARYLIDSFPVAACHNIRIRRCKLFEDEAFRGYCVAKREYVYGLRVHLICTDDGVPVEFSVLPASHSDIGGLLSLPLALPSGAELYGDKAYTDYFAEDALREQDGIVLMSMRKKNSKLPLLRDADAALQTGYAALC